MQQIHSKTLQDLEFDTVLNQLSARCNTELGRVSAQSVRPLLDEAYLMEVLGQTSEFLASFSNENRIPNHGFDTIGKELKLLGIENTTVELAGFRRISNLCTTFSLHKKFFKKFKEYYPLLFEFSQQWEENISIPKEIE
ncbi:MAG: DNA mismatch repair protein MutS, partial [Bacteroidota bacterium]